MTKRNIIQVVEMCPIHGHDVELKECMDCGYNETIELPRNKNYQNVITCTFGEHEDDEENEFSDK